MNDVLQRTDIHSERKTKNTVLVAPLQCTHVSASFMGAYELTLVGLTHCVQGLGVNTVEHQDCQAAGFPVMPAPTWLPQ